MLHDSPLGEEFFAWMTGNYERKPRGGLLAEAGEAFRTRYSLLRLVPEAAPVLGTSGLRGGGRGAGDSGGAGHPGRSLSMEGSTDISPCMEDR